VDDRARLELGADKSRSSVIIWWCPGWGVV